MGSAGAPSTSGFGKPTGTSNINSRTRVVRNLLNPSRLFRGARQPLHMAASTPATVEQEVDTSSRTTNTQATINKNIVCSSSEVFCPTCQQIVQSSRESNQSSGFYKTSSIKLSKKQKRQVQKRMWPYGRKKDTHTHASNDSYEHPPRSEFELVVSFNALT